MTFEQWMKKVNLACVRKYMVSVHDLEDACFYDMYDADMSPENAADEAMSNDSLGSMYMDLFD